MSNNRYYNFHLTYCEIDVDPSVLAKYPKFKDYEKHISPSEINKYLRLLNSRSEIKAYLTSGRIRVVLPETVILEKKGGVDVLGLPLPDRKTSDMCDIIREFTRMDPRQHIVTTKRSLPLSDGMTLDALRVDRLGRNSPRGSHALDVVTDEEIIERRNSLIERERTYEERRNQQGKNKNDKSNRKSVRKVSKEDDSSRGGRV